MDPHNRISFTFVGGPLDGRELVHQILTDALLKEQLHQLDFVPKGESMSQHAQGVYHVEEAETGYVAIHHPSEQDQDWHVPEPKEVKIEEPVKEQKNIPQIKLPENSALHKRMARFGNLFPKNG